MEQQQRMTQAAPSFYFTIERLIALSPGWLFWAWTEGIDQWLAVPGTVRTNDADNQDLLFDSRFSGKYRSYAMRFLYLLPGQLIVSTWLSAPAKDAGTVLSVKLLPEETGTRLILFHDGFANEAMRDSYGEAWVKVLDTLEDKLVFSWLMKSSAFLNHTKTS